MPSQRKLVQTSVMSIRWGDMDVYGHVNNTVYFRYMEQCRVEYLESLGARLVPQGTAPVIINAACTFLVPLNYPGEVEVRMFCGQPGRSSVQTHFEIRLAGDDRLYATGDAKIVWMDVESGKSAPIPDEWREKLSA